MELPSSRKKSFKKPSDELSLFSDLEEQPILSNHNNSNIQSNTNSLQSGKTNGGTMDCREVIVKIDPSGTSSIKNIRQDNKYELWSDGVPNNDPPSKLIEQFIDRQRAAGGEVAFDVDFNNDRNNANLCPEESPPKISIPVDQIKKKHRKIPSKDIKVPFRGPSNGHDSDNGTSEEEDVVSEMRSNITSSQLNNSKVLQENRPNNMQGDGEVLRCTSFQQRQAAVLRSKTRSRLLDNSDNNSKTSGKVNKSGQIKPSKNTRASGMLKQQTTEEEEEDDPFKDDDIPDEFKNNKMSIWTIIQWISLVIIVASLICTLVIHEWKEKMFKGLQIWKWELLILVLICGRLVSGWWIRLMVFFIERNFLLRKRVLYFVYGVKDAVQNCIWLGLVLLAWRWLFDEKIEAETNTNFLHIVNKIMFCLLVGSLFWLVKTLLVKVLASSFHVSTFFDRIQDSLFNQHVIETLSGPPSIEIQTIQEEEDRAMADIQQLQSMGIHVPPELRSTTFTTTLRSGELQRPQARTARSESSRNGNINNNNKQQEGIPIHQVHQWNPTNISAWNMKRLTKMVRHGMLTTLNDQIHGASGDESSTQIRNEFEAKVAARKIFQNVARSGSKNIYLLDVMRFMPEDEAFKTITLLSGSPDREKVSKSALKSWVVNAFRERKALALSLNDTKTAVNKLHHMVNALVSVIIVVVCLLILGIATTKFLLFLSSQLLVAAFVFGNTCKTIFESIIFLFVMHPFDVGDRCEVDGVQLIVEEMNILNTIFLRADNQRVYFPNSTLSQKPLGNYYRSPDMCDTVDFFIHLTTPAEKIALMKQRIVSFVENKKDHWYNETTVVLLNVEQLDKVKFSVWTRHRMNHQDMKERYLRRALLVEEMIKIFKDYDIEYRLIPKDINIRSWPALTRTPDTWNSPDK